MSLLKSGHERPLNWTAIVVTAPNQENAYAFDFSLYFSILTHSDMMILPCYSSSPTATLWIN